uniref:Uncharacterized protein n=1 Tax=Magallana gigas TaxID=29159 RepID=K1PZY7_MAGGI
MEGMSWNLLLVTRILAMNWTELEQWKLVLTGFAMSDRNNTLSRQIARTFLTKYIKQNQDLITKFDTPLSPNTVESMMPFWLSEFQKIKSSLEFVLTFHLHADFNMCNTFLYNIKC